MRTLVWFRGHDLRLSDHAPLRRALERGEVVPLFVLDPRYLTPEGAGQAPHRAQFLLDSLTALAESIHDRGSELLVVWGPSARVVPRIALDLHVDRVVAHLSVAPAGRARDAVVRSHLAAPLQLFAGQTLAPPGSIRTKEGRPYSVFTRFAARFHEEIEIERPLGAPRRLPPLPRDVHVTSDAIPTLESLGLRRNPSLPEGGERAARARLRRFLRGPAAR
jgi:deoxyribodipyrimidine photo-lyase